MEKTIKHFPTANKLHTDMLEEKYGQITADVLRHDKSEGSNYGAERIREARLVDKDNVLRTYALTFLTYDKHNTTIAAIDDEIRAGGAIGKSFRKHGFEVKKNVIDAFILDIPERMRVDFHTDSTQAKARLTEFYAKDNIHTPVIYGIVLEVYSPDFRDPNDGINKVDKDQINPLTGSLQDSGVPIDEIRSRLDCANDHNERDDLKERYEQAQEASRNIIAGLHQKVKKYLASKSI